MGDQKKEGRSVVGYRRELGGEKGGARSEKSGSLFLERRSAAENLTSRWNGFSSEGMGRAKGASRRRITEGPVLFYFPARCWGKTKQGEKKGKGEKKKNEGGAAEDLPAVVELEKKSPEMKQRIATQNWWGGPP